jgi:hypothetical protein
MELGQRMGNATTLRGGDEESLLKNRVLQLASINTAMTGGATHFLQKGTPVGVAAHKVTPKNLHLSFISGKMPEILSQQQNAALVTSETPTSAQYISGSNGRQRQANQTTLYW